MADLRILPQVLQMHLSGHSSNSKLFSRYLGWFLSRVIFGKWGVSPYGSENFILISKFSEASGAEKKTYVRLNSCHMFLRWRTVFLCASPR